MAVHSPPTLLLTRPRSASERFAEGLRGFDVVIAPLVEIVGTGAQIQLDHVQGLILTSENAVPFLPVVPVTAYCVGPRTAEAARGAGFRAEVVGPDADGLVAGLMDRAPSGPLMHPHGVRTRGDVAGRLNAGGLNVREVAVYDQLDCPPDEDFLRVIAQKDVIVPLFSPLSASRFAKALGDASADLTILAMSDAVKSALPERLRRTTQVIAHPTGAEMRRALETTGLRRNSP